MAEKKSILGGLKNMLHLDSAKPSKPAPKPAAAARKKAAAPVAEKAPPAKKKAKEQPDAAPSTDAPADQAPAPEATSEEKKKLKNQPWYRHRQRW